MFSVQAANIGLSLLQNYPGIFLYLFVYLCIVIENYLEGKYEGMQIWTDGMRITQIVSNIVSNAVKFTHKGNFFIVFRFAFLF
jgi:signal transduction histidine kinase